MPGYWVTVSAVLLLAYVIHTILWRLFLSPLSRIPGPQLAALTSLYEMYYDVWLGGQYVFKILVLHKTYGPIIRIAPSELHISDPDFYDTIYAGYSTCRRTEKHPTYARFTGLDSATFATTSHELHHERRSALQPYFSMSNVRRLQPVIEERLEVLQNKIYAFKNTDQVLNASCMFSALGNDILSIYCFGQCDAKIEQPDFDTVSREAALAGITSFHVLKRVPWVHSIIRAMPLSLVTRLQPALGSFLMQQRDIRQKVGRIIAGEARNWEEKSHLSIFHAILGSRLSSDEKTVARLADEAQVLVMAGTLTVSSTLEVIVFWLLRQPETLLRLKKELAAAMPKPGDVGKVPLSTLQSLPFLTGVVKEGLRLSYGLSTRSERIDPDNPIVFRDRATDADWTIPAGTPVSLSSVQLHRNEANFPDSHVFRPERWLGSEGKRLDRYLVAFSRGSRNCLGINLANGELYLTLSHMWRLWGSRKATLEDDVGFFSLSETGLDDVEIAADYFIPTRSRDSRGIRLKVHSP